MSASESELVALIRKKFPAPEYATFAQVRNSTGYAARVVRTADALTMSLWPSRGLHIHGFEVKSSRSDWLREKKDPSKAEEIAQFCDFWSLVVADERIAPLEELPAAWGLFAPEVRKGVQHLKCLRQPTDIPDPRVITRQFLASILKCAQEDAPAAKELAAMEERVRNAAHAHFRDEIASLRAKLDSTQRAARDVETLRIAVDSFEEKSGIRITGHWSAGRMGEAVKALISMGRDDLDAGKAIEKAETQLRDAADRLAAARATLVPEPLGEVSHG